MKKIMYLLLLIINIVIPSYLYSSSVRMHNSAIYIDSNSTIGAKHIGYYNDGNQYITILNTGNVGIGTTDPNQKLSVVGTIESTSGGFRFPDGTSMTTAATGDTYRLESRDGDPNVVYVDAAQNVGIGDTTPEYKLDVAGTVGIDSTLTLTGSAANIALGSNYLSFSGSDAGLQIGATGNAILYGNASTYTELTITNPNGYHAYLGLSTNVPAIYNNLWLIDNYATNKDLYFRANSYSSGERLVLYDDGGASFYDYNLADIGDIALDSLSSDAGTSINVDLGSDAGDDFKVDTSKLIVEGDRGRVGINESDPNAMLDIVINGATNPLLPNALFRRSDTTASLYIRGNDISSGYFIDSNDADFLINYRGYLYGNTRTRDTIIYDGKTNPCLFVQGSTKNVGIGTVDPNYPLNVNGNVGITGNLIASANVSGATYGSDSSISDAELLILDNGATTEILVGGGAGSTPVWTTATGTGAPVRADSPTFTTKITTPQIYGTTNGNIGLNGASVGTSGVNVFSLYTGTAPTTSPADLFQLWVADYNGATTARLYGRSEEGNSQPIALLSETQIAYGVAWDENADSYIRLGRTVGHKVAATLPTGMLPIQESMKRCILTDAGAVAYFLSPTNSAYKIDGTTASNLTGTDGQVMVRIPKFWYRYSYIGTTHYWEISPCGLSDFDPHPAFYKDGAWVDYRYIGAYEGSLYDTSASLYVDGIYQTAVSCVFADANTITCASRTAPFKFLTAGQKIVISGTVSNNGTLTVTSSTNQVITVNTNLTAETAAATVISTEKDYTATTGDKLSSVNAKTAINYLTRVNARVIASNRGTGWRQLDFSLISAIQLLYLTEYASFYSQSMIGAGISNVTDWGTYNDYNPIAQSGNSNSIGNATGNTAGATSAATEVTKYLSYRGIENWYGHLWKWEDGININNNIPYITNNATNWADDTATNYTRPNDVLGVAITMGNVDGWQNTLCKISDGFLPLTMGASSSTKITDYYWQASDWKVAFFGGDAHNGAHDGAFCAYLAAASSDLERNIVSRAAF